MSTIGKLQDNNVVDSILDDLEFREFIELNDEERALEQTLLNACLVTETESRQMEQPQQSTLSVEKIHDKKPKIVSDSINKNEQEKDGVEHLNGIKTKNQDVTNENKQSIKIEFTCSPERLVEPSMDYTLDDVIEICSMPGEEDESSDDDVVSTILNEQQSNCALQPNALNDNDDNEELLTVFNDHNYTTPETAAPTADTNQDLRQNIIDHIVKKRSLDCNNSGNCDDDALGDSSNDSAIEEDAKKEIEDFVDQILEGKIEPFVGKNDGERRNVHVKQEFSSEAAIRTEDFVQNIINVVADEDAAEYDAEKKISHQKQQKTVIESSSHKNQMDNQSGDETETFSFKWVSSRDAEKNVSKNQSETSKQRDEFPIRMDNTDNESGKQSSSASVADSSSQLGSNVTLPDYCSEPLEVIPLDERFEQCEKAMEEIEIPFEERFNQLEKAMERSDAILLDNCVEQVENHKEQADQKTEDHLVQPEESIAEKQGIDNQNDHIQTDQGEKTLNNSEENAEQLQLRLLGMHILSKENTQMSEKSEEHEKSNNYENNMPHTLDADFQRLDKTLEEVETSFSASSLLKEFSALVNEMHNDCATFSMATSNIDARLSTYIVDKFKIIRSLVRRCNNTTESTECASQTGPELFRNYLRKLNKKDKRDLLASTDSSSSSRSDNCDGNTSSSNDELDNRNKRVRKSRREKINKNPVQEIDTQKEGENVERGETVIENIASSQLSQSSTLNSEYVYDDGVTLTKYLRSDVFSAANDTQENDKTSVSSTSSRSRSPSTSSSSEEGTSQEQNNYNDSAKDEQKKKGKKGKALDENDKEIERLINLDGLMKRHNNAGTSKQVDIDKLKTKTQIHKNKTDGVLDFLEKDLPKESMSSEESVNEDEEEIITEKQFLKRHNQALKNQLLNESSNDTSEDEEADEEFAPVLSDESESGNRSPLVDKFLKTYNIEESDEDDVEISNEGTSVKEVLETSPKTDESKKVVDGVASKNEENSEHNTANISENSDCELLNDSFICRKRTTSKSLEKILSETEKRKKIQKLDESLISLSSESDCSDVEAVEIEPAESEKSRAIKPMLRPDQLQRETLKAQKGETERIRRLEKRQAMLTKVLAENKEIKADEELVLDYNEETKTFIKVHPGLVKHLKSHQRDGVRFMYDSCYGGVDSVKKNYGSGCILAHCMGLGKTLQLIALMHTVISYKELKTNKVLVLCPKSTVMNWGDEITRWLYPLRTKNFKVFTFSDTSDINEKLSVMREWSLSHYQKAGCLLIGYEAFRTLVFYHKYKIRNNLDSTRLETIRNLIDEYLLQPGADLVVCDEGHIIKNSKSAISLAVAKIKTQKRIVLTGTPIQNNLKEYYSMVNFIKPLFLGTEKEFANLYANPIKNGQHKDSSKRDIKVMKQRSFVLHKKLSKFVQRKEAELLKSFLPKKFEYVLFIPMTSVQNKLYERILETINSRQDHRGRSLITDYTCLRKIWTHPKVLEDAWKNAVNQKFKRDTRKQPNSDDDQPDDIYDSQTGFMSVKNDWWRNLIAEKDLESILPSNKLRTMFEILRMCEENGDKCLIFSAFVAVLNVVEYFFQKLAQGDKEIFSELNMPPGVRSTWEPNKDYFRLDGKTSKSTRHEMIKRFNQPQNTRARVFLISAKAGGQGINLIGANRVIILDTSWNPSNDQQNIFRIFRLGQKKNCYIYRLLALGTMEEKVYSRSVTKQAMSFRVMDVQQIDRHYSMAELAELYTLTIPNYSERPTPILPQDTILANLLRSFPDLVYKYHEHDSLLENKVEQELSEQEKIDAWNAYENDLQMNSQMANMEDMQNKLSQGNLQNYMGAGGSIPGLNLQALLNFRGLNASANSSYINQSLLQQYKYNLANQQYLDLVNNYRQYSSTDNAAAYNASVAAAYSSMNPSMYPGVAPSVSPQHTGNPNISANTTAHPLSALNDLSMFGLGMGSSTNPAAATSLSPLSSTSTNASSLYATPNVPPTPSVSAAGLYSNTVAAYYQSLQQLGFVGPTPSNSNMINNPGLNSFTNPPSFQAPRRTSPQATARKSSTPDLTGYRSNGGSINMTTVTTPTSTMPISTTSMTSTSSRTNDKAKFLSNISNVSSNNTTMYNSKSEAMNSATKRNDTSSSRAVNKPVHNSTSSTMNVTNVMTLARSESSTIISQNRSTPTPTSVATVTSISKPLTTATHGNSKSTSKSVVGAIPSTPTTKASDPQIRVKDMGQLCANSSRGSSAPVATGAAVAGRDVVTNTVSGSSKSSSSNSSGRSKQSTDMIVATTSATAAELLKKRSEMQIIPTTSPPGTASISKQLSEISPSISLTAVRNTNAKPSNNNTANFNKVSGTATSKANSNKTSRVNSPSNISSPTLTNRQLTTSTSLQQRKNINNSNTVVLSNTTNAKKTVAASVAATLTPAISNFQSRKTVTSVPQSSLTVTTVSSSSSNANSNAAKVSTNSSSNNSNNAKYSYTQSGARTNMATITPSNVTSTTTTTTPSKNLPNILRNHHIRKMPSPLPTTLGITPTSNMDTKTSSNISSNVNQSGSTVNAKSTFASSIKSNTMPTVTVGNAAQLIYNNKNTTSIRRSFSPTATISHRTSRTLSPANVSTPVTEKLALQGGTVGTANKVKTTTLSTPPAATTTSAFPIHLQRSNSALGTMRTNSPLNTVKATAVSGLGNRTKSTTAIVTPKIASVASLNNTTISAVTSSTSSSSSTAARVAALKKISTNNGKTNVKSIKQLPSTTLSALKAAAAASVVQQKRISTSGGVSSASQQHQQQPPPQQQQPSKRITIQANGKSLNVGINPQNITRILPGDAVIGGANMRTIFKGSTTGPSSGSSLHIGEKRSQSGVQPNSASGQPSSKLLKERKRKAPDLLYKESGNLNKRPKES